ncbi:MAG: glycoside hydrolase family 97 catalytic domain-containing protein, partial [Balneolaceae bacterium]|nr:glycoside hydrolase family 97 catalytic domain-containing protein [Balneolaceae bacterium]
ESFFTHQERSYLTQQISEIGIDRRGSIPALVDIDGGPNLLISEADLRDYPGFYLEGTDRTALRGIFPHVATEEKLEGDRNLHVTERADFIAETAGSRSYPWRMIAIAAEDADLLTNQLVYKLAQPNRIPDTSWIEPGKVAWDWWNANNIYGVDFDTGVNTETYKYYIDFASEMGLDYIILDEGWYELGDLTGVSENMDIDEIVSYGKSKNVDVILWVVWKTLEDQWEVAFRQFEEWDVRGIKVDFMQRDDQWMVNWYWKVAEEAARRKLLVDFHGSYKSTGLERTYPNVITREDVKGMEHNKWSTDITPEHNLILPFVRMVAGPMDYTPGAMINATEENFRAVFNKPMSMGTRAHELAKYVVYESPLQMLCDSPSHYYEQEPELLEYLSEVPVIWDETRVLAASLADYVVLARKKGITGTWRA